MDAQGERPQGAVAKAGKARRKAEARVRDAIARACLAEWRRALLGLTLTPRRVLRWLLEVWRREVGAARARRLLAALGVLGFE
jgi:hypothetical protein